MVMDSYLRYAFISALLGGFSVSLLLFLMTGRGFRLRGPLPRLLRGRRERFPGQVPVTVAAFLMGFGAAGLLLSESLGYGLLVSLPAAVLSGGSFVAVIVALFRRLFGGEASAMAGGTLVGTACHVCLAIPNDGVGAVAYHAEGKRHTMPARTADGHAVMPRTEVLISDLRAGVAVVEEF